MNHALKRFFAAGRNTGSEHTIFSKAILATVRTFRMRGQVTYLPCRRSRRSASEEVKDQVHANGSLEMRVCVRTYRLFYVADTEEFIYRIPSADEREQAEANLKAHNAQRMTWLEEFTARDVPAPATTAATTPTTTSTAATATATTTAAAVPAAIDSPGATAAEVKSPVASTNV